MEKQKFMGLRTVKYNVDDIEKAKEWYTRILVFKPYFDEPFYVGFNVAGYELGLQPAEDPGETGIGGVTAYWGVHDIESEHARLLELGAAAYSPIQDVGDGIKVATVRDPFGNLFGIIENPVFKLENP